MLRATATNKLTSAAFLEIQTGGRAGNRILLPRSASKLVLGTDVSRCNVVFDPTQDPQVGHHHAEVHIDEGRVFIWSVNGSHVTLNGQRVQGGLKIDPGRHKVVLGIGGPSLLLELPNEEDADAVHLAPPLLMGRAASAPRNTAVVPESSAVISVSGSPSKARSVHQQQHLEPQPRTQEQAHQTWLAARQSERRLMRWSYARQGALALLLFGLACGLGIATAQWLVPIAPELSKRMLRDSDKMPSWEPHAPPPAHRPE